MKIMVLTLIDIIITKRLFAIIKFLLSNLGWRVVSWIFISTYF